MQYTKSEIMRSLEEGSVLDDFPICSGNEVLKVALDKMNLKGLGFCIIYDDEIGILTDGDIRRKVAIGNMPLHALLLRPLKNLGTFPCTNLSLPFDTNAFDKIARNGKTYVPIIEDHKKCSYVIDVKRFARSGS